jgi:Domain of unknown function (DUF5602)
MKKVIYFLFASSIMLSSCKKEDAADPNPTYKGKELNVGNGKVYSYVKFIGDIPSSVGITITKAGLENLPHDKPVSLSIPMPVEVNGKIPFTHVYFDFSHSGHEPAGVYTYPHFDIHFMFQPDAERAAIGPYNAESAIKFDKVPEDGVIPAPYFKLPEGVPLMGAHWLNPATSPEVVPGGPKFTETLIMGSYDGKWTFIEPMIILEFLQNHPSVSKDIPQGSKVQTPGYYPKKYSIQHAENGDCNISLEGLVMR